MRKPGNTYDMTLAVKVALSPNITNQMKLVYVASILWKLCPNKNPKLKFTKGNKSKNIWNRVMVLVHCTYP